MPLDGTTLPPPQYDHTPNMPVIERVLSVTEINRICIDIIGKETGQGRIWWGCAQTKYQDGKLVCIIHRIDNPQVLRHENGHCNGWGPDHPPQEVKEAVAKPILPDWAHPTPQLPWPKVDPNIDALKQVLTAAKELSNQIRR